MGRRVGLVRFDSDCGSWCFDEECQIRSLEEKFWHKGISAICPLGIL